MRTPIDLIKTKRLIDISEEISKGKMTISAKRCSEITGWTAESITNSIREGKVHFGFCHRGENCKSWSVVIDLIKLYDYLTEYNHDSGMG